MNTHVKTDEHFCLIPRRHKPVRWPSLNGKGHQPWTSPDGLVAFCTEAMAMNESFCKSFPGMYTGSMRGAGAVNFAVWEWIRTHSDRDGMVEINPKVIADDLGVSYPDVEAAVKFLESEDPDSRTPDEGGRRIVREGKYLFRIVNRNKYRHLASVEDRREKANIRQKRHREKDTSVTGRDENVTGRDENVTKRDCHKSNACHRKTETETETDTHINMCSSSAGPAATERKPGRGTQKQGARLPNPKVGRVSVSQKTALFKLFWEAYPKKVAKDPALKEFLKLDVSQAMVDRMVAAIEVQAQTPKWQKDNGEYILHPDKWLSGKRWQDEVELTEPCVLTGPGACHYPPTQEQLDYLESESAKSRLEKANAKPKQ